MTASTALRAAPTSQRGTSIEAHGLFKRYGERSVLDALELDVEPGQFVAIVGRSGCGKSTLLRLIAGLEEASGGELLLDHYQIDGLRTDTRIMFQEARLLPWRSVIDNVTLGLEGRKGRRAAEVLAKVGLEDRDKDWPAKLSGGQRQRVALARALVHNPRLLLLDEPLGALDALTRLEMQSLIETVWREVGFTALLVTHDVQEAVALADRVILLENGKAALDVMVPIARPRHRGDPRLAAIEQRILDRILQ